MTNADREAFRDKLKTVIPGILKDISYRAKELQKLFREVLEDPRFNRDIMTLAPLSDSTYTEFLLEVTEKLSNSIHYYRIQFELDKMVQLVNILVG